MCSFFRLVGATFLAANLLACSASHTEKRAQKVKVSVALPNEFQGLAQGLTTSVEPSFAGLGVGQTGAQTSYALNLSGETVVEVPQGAIPFRATLVSWSTLGNERVMYVSQASEVVNISSSTSEVVLSFGSYVPNEQVNVYGLVHASANVPAAGAQLSVQDPFSGAWLVAPNAPSLATTASSGVFGFSLPLNSFTSSGNLTLRVVNGTDVRVLSVPASANGKPGVTLPYINLTGSSASVQPIFSNLTDFDNDGTPNSTELVLGTNPFSELSGQAGPQGPQGPAGAGGATLVTQVRNAAGQTFSIVRGSVSSGSSFYGTVVLSDGVVFPIDSTGSFNFFSYTLSTVPISMTVANSTNRVYLDVFPSQSASVTMCSGVSSGSCAANAGNPAWPFNNEACFYYDSMCQGTCYLPFLPTANRILSFPATSSGGGGAATDFIKTTGTEAPVVIPAGSPVPSYYRQFSWSYCNSSGYSSFSSPVYLWTVSTSQAYSFPSGTTYPFGRLYPVE